MVIKAKAYAKTNLFLDITGKRDNGYHEIDTVMQSVSLCDEVSLSLTNSGFTVSCDNAQLSGEGNIALKACEAFARYSGYSGGADIFISKNIPVAAGMGGGSADATAVLLLLNKASGKNLSVCRLTEIATELGADVPFFLEGGTARAQGIGEKLSPIPSTKLYFVFLKELEKQSTGKMYSVLDTIDYPKNGNIHTLISGLANRDINKVSSNIFNAFEFCWNFEEMSSPFLEFVPDKVFLSGSGPTVCAMFSSDGAARTCADTLISRGHPALYAESVQVGVEFV